AGAAHHRSASRSVMSAPTKNPEDRERVLDHLLSAVPGLDRDAAVAALRQAKADHWSSLARLAAEFRDRPHALTQLDSQASAPLVRLAHALHSAGHRGVPHRAARTAGGSPTSSSVQDPAAGSAVPAGPAATTHRASAAGNGGGSTPAAPTEAS